MNYDLTITIGRQINMYPFNIKSLKYRLRKGKESTSDGSGSRGVTGTRSENMQAGKRKCLRQLASQRTAYAFSNGWQLRKGQATRTCKFKLFLNSMTRVRHHRWYQLADDNCQQVKSTRQQLWMNFSQSLKWQDMKILQSVTNLIKPANGYVHSLCEPLDGRVTASMYFGVYPLLAWKFNPTFFSVENKKSTLSFTFSGLTAS